MKRRRRTGWRGMWGVSSLALLALSGCRTKSFFSTKDEINLGKAAARQIEQELKVDTTSPDAERVKRIGQSLLTHMDKREVPYSFRVLDLPEINAFSLPGGPIYVCRGLLDMVGDDDDALASILGHEAGHVNGRHAARQISSRLATDLLIRLSTVNTSDTVFGAVSLGADIIGLKYSREDEFDADRRGLSYAHYAGYNPQGMIRFFHKMERLEKRQGRGDPEWLRTHPINTARVEKAEAIIENKNYRYGK